MNIIDTNLNFKRKLPYNNNPKSLVLHHTECNGWSVERLHQLHKSRGWVGIGYHFYIRKDGSIYKGRPAWTIGAHCKGFNLNSIGIAFEGNYMVDKNMPEAQMKAGLELISYLKNKYGNMKIYGHKEVGSSNCPGTYFPLHQFKYFSSAEGKEVFRNLRYTIPMMIGEDVAAVQSVLQNLKYFEDKIDSIFGANTQDAVVAYQKDHKFLNQRGIVDKDTWNSIMVHK